jgi:hypothetical protein
MYKWFVGGMSGVNGEEGGMAQRPLDQNDFRGFCLVVLFWCGRVLVRAIKAQRVCCAYRFRMCNCRH